MLVIPIRRLKIIDYIYIYIYVCVCVCVCVCVYLEFITYDKQSRLFVHA
jgi:hypothetical protein